MQKPSSSGTKELYKGRLTPHFGEPLTLLWVNLVNTNAIMGLDGEWKADEILGRQKFAYGSIWSEADGSGPYVYTKLETANFLMGPIVSVTYAAQITAGATIENDKFTGTFFVRNTTGRQIRGFWLALGEEIE